MEEHRERAPEERESGSSAWKDRLAEAVEGLFYPSESDEPFELVAWPDRRREMPGPKELLDLLDRPPETPVVEETLAEFFEPLVEERDWFEEEEREAAGRFRELRRILEQELLGLRVYRVGEVEIEVFVLGRTREGWLVGLKTLSVET